MSSEGKIESLVVRLETVTNKLEGIASRGPGGASGGASGGAETPEWVGAFETDVMSKLSEFYQLSEKLGGDIAEMSELVKSAVNEVKAFIELAGNHKRPTAEVVKNLLANVNAASEKIVTFAEERRTSKQMNNLFAVKELFPYSFGFLFQLKPKKIPKEARDQGMFYSNRVLKDYKDKDQDQVNWCRSFTPYTDALTTYIEEYLPSGLEWNPSGPAVAPGAAAPSGSGGSIVDSLSQAGKLKKVDRSQMTHKNPELRGSSVVKAKEATADKPAKQPGALPKKDPVFRLDKKRWRVEHYDNKHDIEVNPTEYSHTLYAFNCSNCTIAVKNKINSITLDKCFKVAVVFGDVISQFECINCQRIEAQSNGQLPLVNIDKSDEIQIYLSKESMNAEIIQAKSSSMNILIPNEEGEFKEIALPEQFRSVLRGKKFETVPTESI